MLELGLEIWAQIHRYCLKIYPKMCHKIILRQKLLCREIILWHILG